MKKVTEKEMTQILLEIETKKGVPMMASVLQFVSAKLVQKSRENKEIKNPYPNTMKFSKVGILLNSDYERAVTRQLVKEGKDESEYKKGENTMPIVFGENNQFFGFFKGEGVLQYRPNDNVKTRTKYFNEGKIVDKAKIEQFLPKVSEAQNQGTDREILWRKLYLRNVKKLAINGEVYKIVR